MLPDTARANPTFRRQSQWGSLPFKTLAGFLVALIAVVLISWLSYRQLEGRSNNVRELQRTQAAVQQLESVLSLLKDAETGQRGYLLTGAEFYLGPYQAALAALPQELDDTRRSLADDPRQLERFKRLEGLTALKLAELEQTVEEKRAGRTENAVKIVNDGRGRQFMDELRTLVTEMRVHEERELDARGQTWRESAALSTQITWGGSSILFTLIAVAFVLSARDFREQQIQGWLRTGIAELAAAIQGDRDLASVGNAAATFLARYLDAQIGAVYKHDKEQLMLVGGWGLPTPHDGKPTTNLPLQALRDNKRIHVRDVPRDYFTISSGSGRLGPNELILVPTSSEGAANGVLEFGFFRAASPIDIELLARASDTVGTALRSAKYRATLKALLEETRRQAQELQSQQEELRVNNEELEQQTKALQESQAQLEGQQMELEQINSRLEEQTQSLEIQKSDLTRAQRELQRANDYKSEFLANMSHELRTPLNSSLILAKLLVDNRDGNLSPEQIKFAQTIYSAGNDLLTLINDILDLSKIEAGQLDVHPEVIPVARLIDELTAIFRPVAEDRQLGLMTSVETAVPLTIETDALRLQQILKNLLSNALKFTEQGGVSLNVAVADGGRISFAVKDTGVGIEADKHQVIFEAFRQADGTTNRKYGGSGLGLSISRDLARLLGGEILVASAPGQGSTFTLVLPSHYVPQLANRPLHPAEPTPKHSSSKTNISPQRPPKVPHDAPQEMRQLTSSVNDDRAAVELGSRIILVIEDDLDFANILRDLARDLSFQVILAQSAESGLAAAERYHPSAIVLDIGLPDRSGLSVLDALKHSPTTRHIPVHVISATDYTQTALEMGAAGYAIKPVQREELVEALRRLEHKFTQRLRRVLVVEDDPTLRESTCHLISGEDVECVAVGTAREALEHLGQLTFDCMILDLSLPDRTGFDLLSEMSGQEHYAFPPVIIYTGRSLSREEDHELRRFSSSIIIKGARSPERLLDEVTLFLHQVESQLPPERQRMLRDARHREKVFEGRRVLIVEDDVRNIFALTSVLEPKGARVEIARNGREALEHLDKQPGVDLVLMDIMMPEMDGLQAMRELRKQPQHAKLPIIALTAKAMADDRDNCLAAGANDYIAKPLDIDKLLSLARVWMPK